MHKTIKKYIPLMILLLIHCRWLQIEVISYNKIHDMNTTLSVIDYMIHFFKGSIPSQQYFVFNIPAIWSLYYFYYFVVIGQIFNQFFSKFEQQRLIRCGTRKKWWNKLILQIAKVTGIYLLITYIMMLIYAICTGGQLFNFSEKFQFQYNGLELHGKNMTKICLCILLMSFVIMMAIASLQCLIGMLFHPLIGFFVSSVLLVTSVYIKLPILLFNYMMMVRIVPVTNDGMELKFGMVISIILFSVSFFIGSKVVQKKDFL